MMLCKIPTDEQMNEGFDQCKVEDKTTEWRISVNEREWENSGKLNLGDWVYNGKKARKYIATQDVKILLLILMIKVINILYT
jgi:hypothetical protein